MQRQVYLHTVSSSYNAAVILYQQKTAISTRLLMLHNL